jgi:superfamily II DNA or RNA helicase
MASKITERTFDLRLWQQEAFRAVTTSAVQGKKDFLCVATPGSGKTKFALAVAHYFMKEKYCERIVVVTPTDSLKRQWAQEAASFAGLDIDPDFNNAMGAEAVDYHGMVVTYSLLGQDKKQIHKQLTFHKKTFVIFDEIHHAGDNLSWGNAVRESFDKAAFRLAISGTAFRSDDNPIPFINYENRVSVADYTYSYDRAIKENVCRPVYFCLFDGKMKWKVGSQEFDHSFKDSLTPDQVSKRLKTALDAKGNWVRDVISAADHKLTEIRSTHPAAGAMIFAATQKHAKELASVVEQITGAKPPVVVSDEADSAKQLEEFKKNNSRWLVSVKMVSEGVDIPRLRIGVYFTIVKAELFFRQAVGRFVRVLKELLYQDAFIFIPQDREVVKLAENIQTERDHALDEAERPGAIDGGAGQTDLFGSEYTPALQGRFVPLASEATDNKTIAVNVEINGGAKHSIDERKPFEEQPVFMQKTNLRERINSLAKRIALQKRNGNTNLKPDWEWAHKQYLSAGGKKMELETVDELLKRLNFYQKLLRGN